MGQLNPPASVLNFKTQFVRDFPYGPGLDKVTDTDIQNALNSASAMFNPCLFDTTPVGVTPNITSEAMIAYLNLSAHVMVTSIQASGGLGLGKKFGTNSQGEGTVGNKSVGGVSVGYVWPSKVTDDPFLSQFTKTPYGQAYLQVLVLKLVGNISAVVGESAEGVFNPLI